MLTLFKLFEINGRGLKPAWNSLEEKLRHKKSSGLLEKTVKAGLIIAVVAGGTLAARWAWKKSYGPRRDLRKKRHELEALLADLIHETSDENLMPKLHRLREMFQTNWDNLMAKEANLGFWKNWLADLTTDGEKILGEATNWNHGRKEKLMTDLESVRF